VEYIADEVAVMYAGKIVERNTAAEIFANPKHDYTKKLLAAIPRIDERLVSNWKLPEGRTG
ncbi:partial putative ABC transporter ATP-binding protein, partial [uncultured bacterium]